MTSWFDTGTKKIRDDGEPGKPEVKRDGKVVQEAVPERPAWPHGAYVIVKNPASSKDLELINHKTMAMIMESDGDLRQTKTKMDYRWEAAASTTVGVLLRGFEGEVFHKDGKPIAVPDDVDERIALVGELPAAVVGFVAGEINRISEDPLGLKKADAPSSKGSRLHAVKT